METRLFSITGEIRSKKGQKGRKAGRPFYGQAKQRRQEGTRPKQMSLEILKRRRRKYCKWDRGKYGIRGNRLNDKEKNGSLPAGQLKQMLLKAWKLRTPIWKNLKCFHDIHLNAKCHWFWTKLQMGNTFCILSIATFGKADKERILLVSFPPPIWSVCNGRGQCTLNRRGWKRELARRGRVNWTFRLHFNAWIYTTLDMA